MRVEKNSFRILHTTSEKIIIESPLRLDQSGREPRQVLVLDQGVVQLAEKSSVYPSSSNGIKLATSVVGLLGMISLASSDYLVVATKRELACTIQHHKIWKITSGELVPFDLSKTNKDALDEEWKMLLLEILNSGHLYFSTSYDLSHSLQHNQLLLKSGEKTEAIIDNRYLFNQHFLSSFKKMESDQDTKDYLINVICGFAGSIDMQLEPKKEAQEENRLYTVSLISRINHKRLGTRYLRRGLDFEGNTANNVEMEQIVFHHDFSKNQAISSFCQIRGSVPCIWGQELDLSYKPKLLIADISKPDIWTPIKKHYQDLLNQYTLEEGFTNMGGKVVCVNLLDTVKFEGPLTETFKETVGRLNNEKVEYEEFPMHKYCKRMNYRNMDILLDRVRQRLVNSGWFLGEGIISNNSGLRIIKIQTGVTRVSCLDSLDRTNLTCSMFARYILAFQVFFAFPK
jgi:hypothetical protein